MKNFLTYITQLNLPVAFLLLAGSVALWLPDVLNSVGQPSLYYTWIYFPHTLTAAVPPVVLVSVSFVVCVLNALMLMILLFRCGATRDRSLMPVVLYMFMSGVVKSVHYNPSAQLALLIFSIVLLILYEIYRQPYATEEIFIVTLMIIAASVFVPDMLFFIVFVWVAMIFERALSLRSWLASVVAVATVALYMMLYVYLSGDYSMLTVLDDLFARHVISFSVGMSLYVKIIFLLLSAVLSGYYFFTRPQLNVKHFVAYDLFLIAALFMVLLTVFPSTEGALYPVGIFVFSAMIAHYFIGSPSVVRGVMFVLYFMLQIVYYFV